MKIDIVQTSWKATNFTETNALWNTVHTSKLFSSIMLSSVMTMSQQSLLRTLLLPMCKPNFRTIYSVYFALPDSNHLYSGRWTGDHGLLWYKTIIYSNISNTRDIMMAFKCWAVSKIFMFLCLHHNHTPTSTDRWNPDNRKTRTCPPLPVKKQIPTEFLFSNKTSNPGNTFLVEDFLSQSAVLLKKYANNPHFIVIGWGLALLHCLGDIEIKCKMWTWKFQNSMPRSWVRLKFKVK